MLFFNIFNTSNHKNPSLSSVSNFKNFSNLLQWGSITNTLEHSHQLFNKKCHFDTLKTYFTILAHHFTSSSLTNNNNKHYQKNGCDHNYCHPSTSTHHNPWKSTHNHSNHNHQNRKTKTKTKKTQPLPHSTHPPTATADPPTVDPPTATSNPPTQCQPIFWNPSIGRPSHRRIRTSIPTTTDSPITSQPTYHWIYPSQPTTTDPPITISTHPLPNRVSNHWKNK